MTQFGRSKELVAELVGPQHGRVSLAQLRLLGVSTSTAQTWEATGYLQRVLPRVYAVGHAAPSREADLWAAVLYAGPGAMLSHGTAARWRGLIDYAPRTIQTSTPRDVRSIKEIKVYGRRRELMRDFHNGMPVTSIPVTMVDLAATAGRRAVDRALGQLDFQKLLDVDGLLAACGNGRRGATALRAAIEDYDPRRKYANGRLEEDFLDLLKEQGFLEMCTQRGLPLPMLNTYVHNIKCDAYWPAQGLVVELDSELAHFSAPQRRRDRRNDLILRGHGLMVNRYDWDLVHEHPDEVCADVVRMLGRLVDERRRRSA